MGTYLYKYLITLNVLQRKIETVSNSLIIDMQTTNRISKQLSEIISMYWCFSCRLFNNCVVLKKIIKNIKYIYNEFKLSKTLKRLLWVILNYIFFHYSRFHRLRYKRNYFVDKKVLVCILFPNQAQEKNVCLFWKGRLSYQEINIVSWTQLMIIAVGIPVAERKCVDTIISHHDQY